MIESQNKHVGCKHAGTPNMNLNNEGILKVFSTGRTYGNLARKYNYGFLYNFYSGDIHHITSIDKIIPRGNHPNNKYNESYLKTYIGLLKDALLFVNSYCKKLTDDDLKKIAEYDFVISQC